MILAPAQETGPERGTEYQRTDERQPAFIPRSMPKRALGNDTPAEHREIPAQRESRTINSSRNNVSNPEWGAAEVPTIRIFKNAYANGSPEPAGPGRPSARAISNAVVAQSGSLVNTKGATDFLWQWGQFLDHNIIEIPTVDPAEEFDIEVPAGDPYFDPTSSGSVTIPLNRSLYEVHDGVRKQVNAISA